MINSVPALFSQRCRRWRTLRISNGLAPLALKLARSPNGLQEARHVVTPRPAHFRMLLRSTAGSSVANTAVRTLCIMLRTGANSRLLEAAPLLGARARPARGPLPAAGASAPPPLRAWRCICIIWNGDMLDMLGPLRSRAALRSARAHEIFAQRLHLVRAARHDAPCRRTRACGHPNHAHSPVPTHARARAPTHSVYNDTMHSLQCTECCPPLPNLSRCRTQL